MNILHKFQSSQINVKIEENIIFTIKSKSYKITINTESKFTPTCHVYKKIHIKTNFFDGFTKKKDLFDIEHVQHEKVE